MEIIKQLSDYKELPSIIWNDITFSYAELINKIDLANKFVKSSNIVSGEVISLKGDFTPNTIALIFALIENKNIIVPFNYAMKEAEIVKYEIASVQKEIIVNIDDDTYQYNNKSFDGQHGLYKIIRKQCNPGLVLFTSGTSGKPKGAVHDFSKLLEKFKTKRRSLRTVNFLLFDHWGGLNTMFHTLSNGGLVLALRNRRPQSVCEFIQTHKIELLPASPSFLNLLLISEEYKNYDLSSLKIISYGTEPMPQTTLEKIKRIFPNVKLQQTYGLIELGVLRSKSKSDESLWVKIGGEGYDTRIVNNLLEIKADSAMLGYLNAPSPFTEDGWFMTGDQVEVDGEYVKILGRKSEIINVGGDKVYPSEVENTICEIAEVFDATVYGEKNPIMGNIVCARIVVKDECNDKELIAKIKKYCRGKLQNFMVPVKITVEKDILLSDRYKKVRKL